MDPQPDQPQVFVDENVDIFEGEAAGRRLVETRQRSEGFFDPARGVVKVDRQRWEEAQRYEKRSWLVKSRRQSSDRNENHRARLDNYAALRGRVFQRGIELGCGPYTNLRFILEVCAIREITLLDPLLNDYLRHPFCRYPGGRLGGLLRGGASILGLRHPVEYVKARRNAWRIGGWRGRPVCLAPSMIEAFQTPEKFDLLVMINVVEHCLDADAVLAKVSSLLAPGGIFVFGDRLYDAPAVQQLASVLYDAGHPLRVDRSVINGYLAGGFDPLFRAEYRFDQTFHGVRQAGDELYFIGAKRP